MSGVATMSVYSFLILLTALVWGGSFVVLLGGLIAVGISDRLHVAILGEARRTGGLVPNYVGAPQVQQLSTTTIE